MEPYLDVVLRGVRLSGPSSGVPAAALHKSIFAALRPGATPGLSHGFLLGYLEQQGSRFPEGIDVIAVYPKGPSRRAARPAGLRSAEAAAWLYDAPFGLLAPDTSPDPLFVYANRRAQQAFGYRRDEFIGLPSRLPAGGRSGLPARRTCTRRR
jgi:PAS domain-containing protein